MIKAHPREGKANLPFGGVALPFCVQGASMRINSPTQVRLRADMG